MNDQKLQERINIFTPQYQEFLASDFVLETTTALGKEEDLDTQQLNIFQNAVVLYLLCFLDAEECINFISEQANLAPELARPLFGAVISTLPPPIVAGLSEIFIGLNGSPKELSDTETNSKKVTNETSTPDAFENKISPKGEPEIGTAEIYNLQKSLDSLPRIRTLADDIVHSQQEEVVYSNTQEAILREGKRNDSPRWESEN